MTSKPYSGVQSSIQLQQPSSGHLRRHVELTTILFIFLFTERYDEMLFILWAVVISNVQLQLVLSVHQRRYTELTDDILLSLCS